MEFHLVHPYSLFNYWPDCEKKNPKGLGCKLIPRTFNFVLLTPELFNDKIDTSMLFFVNCKL